MVGRKRGSRAARGTPGAEVMTGPGTSAAVVELNLGTDAGSAPGTIAPVVELRDISRTFDGTPPVHALRPSNLEVYQGDYLSIMGPSGSGKSTLLNLLGLLDRPTTGEYLLNGVPTSTASETQRSALRGGRIGFVFQQFHLLPHRTVLDNVMMATLYSGVKRAERKSRALEALDRVHLSHRLDFKPTLLSGGERQRVAIARAVVAHPEVLLADEPTGNLDATNSAGVMDLFDELHAQGLTLIVITHDAEVSARAKRQVQISDGYLSEVPGFGAERLAAGQVPGLLGAQVQGARRDNSFPMDALLAAGAVGL